MTPVDIAVALFVALFAALLFARAVYRLPVRPRRERDPDECARYVDPSGIVWTSTQLRAAPFRCARCEGPIEGDEVVWYDREGVYEGRARNMMHRRCGDVARATEKP